jgi:hypothetical protein
MRVVKKIPERLSPVFQKLPLLFGRRTIPVFGLDKKIDTES